MLVEHEPEPIRTGARSIPDNCPNQFGHHYDGALKTVRFRSDRWTLSIGTVYDLDRNIVRFHVGLLYGLLRNSQLSPKMPRMTFHRVGVVPAIEVFQANIDLLLFRVPDDPFPAFHAVPGTGFVADSRFAHAGEGDKFLQWTCTATEDSRGARAGGLTENKFTRFEKGRKAKRGKKGGA